MNIEKLSSRRTRAALALICLFPMAAAAIESGPSEIRLDAGNGISALAPTAFTLSKVQSPLGDLDFKSSVSIQGTGIPRSLSIGEKIPAKNKKPRKSALLAGPIAAPANHGASRFANRRAAKDIDRAQKALKKMEKTSKSGSLEDGAAQGAALERALAGNGEVLKVGVDFPPTSMPEGFSQAELNWDTSDVLSDWLKSDSPDLAKPFPRLIFSDNPPKKDWDILAQTLRKNPGVSATIFLYIYGNLEFIAFTDAPAHERAAFASYAADRYARFLARAAQNKSLPNFFREQAKKSGKSLADGTLVQSLILARQAKNKLLTLNALLPKDAEHDESAEDGMMISPWEIPQPTEKSKRGKIGGQKTTIWKTFDDLLEPLVSGASKAAKTLSMESLLLHRQFSEKFQELIQSKLSNNFSNLRSDVSLYDDIVKRLHNTTIWKGFFPGKERKLYSRARWKGLKLIESPNGFIIRAHFLTDIANQGVLQAVKTSIEDYWRGKFSYRGKNYQIKTEVSFEPIDPEKDVPGDALQIRDSGNRNSHVHDSIIYLERRFDYATPAHEFGHILGLADEYQETYDFIQHQLVSVSQLNSLMSDHAAGAVLPRHFKTVYQLLRRRVGIHHAEK